MELFRPSGAENKGGLASTGGTEYRPTRGYNLAPRWGEESNYGRVITSVISC
jgi:hypothetical protein